MGNLVKRIRLIIIQVIDYFYTPFKKFIPLETFRYAATGGFNTVLDITLYFLCYNFIIDKQVIDLGIVSISPHIAAFLIVFPITFFTGFLFAKFITFYQFRYSRASSVDSLHDIRFGLHFPELCLSENPCRICWSMAYSVENNHHRHCCDLQLFRSKILHIQNSKACNDLNS